MVIFQNSFNCLILNQTFQDSINKLTLCVFLYLCVCVCICVWVCVYCRPDLELQFKCYHHEDRQMNTNWPASVQV